MKTRSSRSALVALLCATMFVGIAACDGGSESNEPPPGLTHCQVVWANSGSVAGRFDIYIIDMPIAEWVSGAKTFDRSQEGLERTAMFYNEMLVASNAYASRAIATNGSFDITSAGFDMGQAVTLTDDGAQQYFDFNGQEQIGNQAGDGGVANFTGVWSDPTPDAAPDPGTGTVTLTYMAAAQTIGTYTRYAVCYDANATAFAPVTAAERIGRTLREGPLGR